MTNIKNLANRKILTTTKTTEEALGKIAQGAE